MKQCLTLIVGALLLMASHTIMAANDVATIKRVIGNVVAATPEGDIRTLAKGDIVNTGETINTGPYSLVQIDFNDESIVTLRSNSRFLIEDYHHEVEKPDEDKNFFNLLKGGLRTVTGLIGKRSKDQYHVNTAVATIGIRGTDYELRHCAGDCQDIDPVPANGLYVGVGPDSDTSITITNNAGIQDLVAGQFAYVAGPNSGPLPLGLRPRALGNKPLVCE